MADFQGDLALGGDVSSGESRGTVYWHRPISLLPRLFRSPLFLSPPFSSPQSSPATDPVVHGPSTTESAVPERRHHWRTSHHSARRRREAPSARAPEPAAPSCSRPDGPRASPYQRRRSPPPLCNHDISMKLPRSETEGCKQSESSGQRIEVVNISSSPSISPGLVSSSEDDVEAHSTPGYILESGTQLTDAQKKEMEVKVQSIQSAIPLFGCIMKGRSVFGEPCSLDLSREYADEYLPLGMTTLTLQRNGKNWEVQCFGRVGESKRLQCGWKQFADDNDLQLGDLCLFELVGNKKHTMNVHVIPMKFPRSETEGCKQRDRSGQRIEVVNIGPLPSKPSGHVSSAEDDTEAHSLPSYILERGTELTDAQKKEMEVKVRSIHSVIPLFGCIMKSSSVSGEPCTLDLSREYADEYLPLGMKTLTLQRQGKNWEVHCVGWAGESKRLQHGWKQFADDNDLQLGDLCLFELVGNKKHTMNVHVIRVK